MKPDFEVRLDGMKALVHALGPVEAERFITLLNLDSSVDRSFPFMRPYGY